MVVCVDWCFLGWEGLFVNLESEKGRGKGFFIIKRWERDGVRLIFNKEFCVDRFV